MPGVHTSAVMHSSAAFLDWLCGVGVNSLQAAARSNVMGETLLLSRHLSDSYCHADIYQDQQLL
jgi:hypothetical protein